MPLFKFKAIDINTNIVENSIKAATIEEARQIVLDKGFTPIRLEEAKGIGDIQINIFNRLKLQDIVLFCRELAIIIKSGISLTVGLDILQKQSENNLKEASHNIYVEVQKGKTLSQAMKESELKFPDLLVKMISTGEFSGNLDSVLDNMGDYYERESFIRQKVKGAMIYPSVLVGVGILLLVFFSTFILPSLEELLEGQELPFITQFVINGGKLVASWGFFAGLLFLIFVVIAIIQLMPKEMYKKIRDTILLRIPIIGPVVRLVITVRFTRTLYLLLKSGLDIVNILEILKKVISNSVVESNLEYALEGVKRGEKLGLMLNSVKTFEPLILQMITIGEETGELEKILEEVTKFYEKKLEMRIEKLVAMVEPAFTLIIGGFIAFIIVAMALPIFGMVGGLNGSGGGMGLE